MPLAQYYQMILATLAHAKPLERKTVEPLQRIWPQSSPFRSPSKPPALVRQAYCADITFHSSLSPRPPLGKSAPEPAIRPLSRSQTSPERSNYRYVPSPGYWTDELPELKLSFRTDSWPLLKKEREAQQSHECAYSDALDELDPLYAPRRTIFGFDDNSLHAERSHAEN
jgi:hypothetical protein